MVMAASYDAEHIMQLDEDKFFDEFNTKLRKVRRVALFTNGMYVVISFLDFCSLTWATTVILGGDLESISKEDYAAVGLLLLFGALHFIAARFFGFIVMQKIISCTTSSDPDLLIDSIDLSIINDDKKEHFLQSLIGLAEQGFQIVIALPLTVVIPIISLSKLRLRYPARPDQQCPASASAILKLVCRALLSSTEDYTSFNYYNSTFSAPITSLKVFYILVLCNAMLNIVVILIIKPALLSRYVNRSPYLSLRKFYDKIVWTNLEHGFVQSWVDIDFLAFSFQVQADEYKKNQRALVVMKRYGDMMTFLYCHPRFKAFEKARELLETGDPYEREAAANIVGCWVKLMKKNQSGKINTLRLQRKLLSKLAETMDHEETGRAATWSFEALAETNPEATAGVKSEKGERLADILMDRIHEAVEEGKPDKALVFIQVWIHILPVVLSGPDTRDIWWDTSRADMQGVSRDINFAWVSQYCTPSKVVTLQNDLLRIVLNPRTLKRTQTVAAYALHVSEDPQYASRDVIARILEAPTPNRGEQNIMPHEKNWLFKVLHPHFQHEPPADWNLPSKWGDQVVVAPEIVPWSDLPVVENEQSNGYVFLGIFRSTMEVFLKFASPIFLFMVSLVLSYKIVVPSLLLHLSHTSLEMTDTMLQQFDTTSLEI